MVEMRVRLFGRRRASECGSAVERFKAQTGIPSSFPEAGGKRFPTEEEVLRDGFLRKQAPERDTSQ